MLPPSPPPNNLTKHVRYRTLLDGGIVYGNDMSGTNIDEVDKTPSIDPSPPVSMHVPSVSSVVRVKTEDFPPPDMIILLQEACEPKNQLPEIMPNLKGNVCNGRCNITFLHDFFGMCS